MPSPRTSPAAVLLAPLLFGGWVAALVQAPGAAAVGAVVLVAVGVTALLVRREQRIRRRAAAPADAARPGGEH
jgi:hypothetical protein